MSVDLGRSRFPRQSVLRGLSVIVFALVCCGAAGLAMAESKQGRSPDGHALALLSGILLSGLLRFLARHDWVSAVCPHCGSRDVVRRQSAPVRWARTFFWAAPLGELLFRLLLEGKVRPASWTGIALPAAGILGLVILSLVRKREFLHCLACRSLRPEHQGEPAEAGEEDCGDPLVLRRIEELAELAEGAYSAMYDSNATMNYSDAKEFLYDAIGLASRSGFPRTAERLSARLAHIKAVFRSQFSS